MLCAAQSMDCANPCFAHNIYTSDKATAWLQKGTYVQLHFNFWQNCIYRRENSFRSSRYFAMISARNMLYGMSDIIIYIVHFKYSSDEWLVIKLSPNISRLVAFNTLFWHINAFPTSTSSTPSGCTWSRSNLFRKIGHNDDIVTSVVKVIGVGCR